MMLTAGRVMTRPQLQNERRHRSTHLRKLRSTRWPFGSRAFAHAQLWISNCRGKRAMEASVFVPSSVSHRITWNPAKFKGVIFDVGMHDGTDTAFYLHQGYAVLAIEADPVLASRGGERFAAAIDAGQLQILNVGIAPRTGCATFWICDDNSLWSSLDKTIASRNHSRHHPVDIETQ